MKRATAIRNAEVIADRLKKMNGIVSTPKAYRSAIRIRRAWLFGSTVKGSPTPQDLDVLMDWNEVGSLNYRGNQRIAGLDIRYFCGKSLLSKEICRNMKMVRLHEHFIDGDLAFPRLMIYPRNELHMLDPAPESLSGSPTKKPCPDSGSGRADLSVTPG